MTNRGVVAQRGHRLRDPVGRRPELAKAHERVACDRLGPHVADPRARGDVRGTSIGLQGAGQLGQQERVAAAGIVRRAHELLVGLGGEQLAQHRCGRRRAERLGPDRARARLAADGLDERRGRLGRRRSGRQHEQHGQLVQAPGEVVREAQRRAIRPVGVVEREQQRTAVGQPGGQPVQPVQQREQLAGRRGRRRRATARRAASPRSPRRRRTAASRSAGGIEAISGSKSWRTTPKG